MVCLGRQGQLYAARSLLAAARSWRRSISDGLPSISTRPAARLSAVLPQYLGTLGVNFRIVESDTYSIVKRVLAEG